MIKRDADPDWLLIGQPEHARLAGELAALWARDPVAPRDSVLYAAAHHDDGWIEWERAPRAHAETGEPVDFLTASSRDHDEVWRRGPALVAAVDPYAGILVSRHGTMLVNLALSTMKPGAEARALYERYLEDQMRFRASLVRALPAALRAEAEPAHIDRNAEIVRLTDYISLLLCMGPVPRRRIADGAAPLEIAPAGERAATLSPWPFDGAEVRREVEAARVPKRRYDDASLRDAIARAPRERIAFTLSPLSA